MMDCMNHSARQSFCLETLSLRLCVSENSCGIGSICNMDTQRSNEASEAPRRVDRRTWLVTGGAAAAAAVAAPWLRDVLRPRASVFIARNQRYDQALAATIRDGLTATGAMPQAFRGKRVLLKPNMVEPSRAIAHMTTHPAMVAAAVEVFRDWGAQVTIGEAPGHVRDTEMALIESGIDGAITDAGARFADLNYEAARWTPNRGQRSGLRGFWFPTSVLEADFVVSMPKMKTHHWMGLTAGMKNLYGVLPGLSYGWPKNVLHHNGIPETVYDINASLPSLLAIVDGIDCMEGDGPILGSLKNMGLVIVGTNLPAVDATAARIMGLVPERIPYLSLAADRLGPLEESRITQRGEAWRNVASRFEMVDQPHLRRLIADPAGPLVT
jgi:uncharacterized protein (DUF362 family)